eukprot:gene9271-12488_t
MKRNISKINKKQSTSSTNNEAKSNIITKYFVRHFSSILKFAGIALVAIFALLLYLRSGSVIQNLNNADPEVLKDAISGELPYLFFCDRSTGTTPSANSIPSIFSELNAIKGSKMGFATVNCSQVLPSGKNLWDRFKLKREWRPTIFGTGPWTKPIQASPTYLKDLASLKKFVETVMVPKSTEVRSDKELWKFCGLTKANPKNYDDAILNGTPPTCIVLLKGTRYNKVQSELEQKLVTKYPKVKFASLEAAKYRLSMEDLEELQPDMFALKLYALRGNGTHYMPMMNPATWDYVDTFTSQAIGASGNEYTEFSNDGSKIKLVKVGAKLSKKAKGKMKSDFKDRSKPLPPSSKKPTDDKADKQAPTKPKDTSEQQNAPVDDGETAAERARRERMRREEMERQAKEHLFDENDSVSFGEDEEESDDEDSVIEL